MQKHSRAENPAEWSANLLDHANLLGRASWETIRSGVHKQGHPPSHRPKPRSRHVPCYLRFCTPARNKWPTISGSAIRSVPDRFPSGSCRVVLCRLLFFCINFVSALFFPRYTHRHPPLILILSICPLSRFPRGPFENKTPSLPRCHAIWILIRHLRTH
jgi:hypothetical protein